MKKILLLLAAGYWLLATGYAQTNKIDINAQIKAVPLTDSGAADAYAVSLSMLGGAYFTGMPVVFKAAHTNTGTSTINVNSIGVKTIKKTDGVTNLSAGDIQSGAVYFLVYDGTNFQLLAPSSASGASSHNLLSATHSDTTAASAVRGDGIFAIGGTPTWQRLAHPSTSGGYFKWNGTDIVASSGAAAGTGSCTNQVVTAENADAAPTCTTITSAYTSGSFSASAHNLLSATHGDTTAASVTRGAGVFGIGASPAWTLVSAPSATNGYFKKNSSGDIISSSGAAGGTGACSTHQFETTDSADASPTCAQPAAADLSDGTTGSGSVVLSVSPALTSNPTAPTQSSGDNSTKIATTAFVQNFAPGGTSAAFAWGGDATDGSVTADGTTTLTCLGAPASTVYTLTRSCFFSSLTVNVSVTIKTNNFAIFVTGTLTNAGSINNDGAVGNAGANSGGSAGGNGGGTVVAAGSNSGVYARLLGSVAGTAGGAGNTGAGSQAPAANGGNNSTAGVDSSGVAGSTGSSGGKGGDGNPNAGGALRAGGSGGTIPSLPGMSGHHQNNAFWGGYHQAAATNWSTYSAPNAGNGGSPGGGGGGGDGTNAGGGGGGGGSEGGYGGMVGIFAKIISNSGTISCNGGTGGAGGNGRTPGAGNTGGGGGGAGGSGGIGGILWLVYQTLSNSGTISANGGSGGGVGTKGSPHGTGVDNAANGNAGATGPAGIVIEIQSQ